MEICFATHNPNKVAELQLLLPKEIQLRSCSQLGIHEVIEENGKTLEENALIKANYVFKKTGLPTFSDDSGLLVEALNGAPGVFSARYSGSTNNEKNIEKVLYELEEKENRKASFLTIIAFINSLGNHHLFEGKVDGVIIKKPKGNNGFGYDPIFNPEGQDKTFAEMSKEEKNDISHRAIAVKKFVNFITKVGIQLDD